MEIVEQKKDCCGCHACYNICPTQAIEMQQDEEGFLYPVILQDKCIKCNRCKNVCPVLNKPEDKPFQTAYGCYANKKEEQMTSSSGGIFSVLARKVLFEQGIVCGAAYDKTQAVYHLMIDSEEDLYRLKETKYVQSQIGDVFKTIKDKLGQEKMVLFSGTPCQVAGLKKYLGKDYENLLCIDLICHGVPSPEVWQRYRKEIANGKEIERVSFRNKTQGMSKITIDYYLSDGNVIKENYADSIYMKGFIQNLYVRPSCFECKFKGIKRCSDLTLGDFWSVKEYHPDFDNGNGISAVIVHSENGKKWIEKIKSDIHIVETTTKKIACWNENLLVSTVANPNRVKFFSQWNNQNLRDLIVTLTQQPIQKDKTTMYSRLKNRIKKRLR